MSISLFNSKTGDLAIKIKDKTILVHKHVLQKESVYFKNAFNSGMEESNRKEFIVEWDYEPFLIFIKLFYDTELIFQTEFDILFKVLQLCDYYDCEKIYLRIENILIQNLNINTIINIGNLCFKYNFAYKIKKEVMNNILNIMTNYKNTVLNATISQINNKCYDLKIDRTDENPLTCCLHNVSDIRVTFLDRACCKNNTEEKIKNENNYTTLCCKHRRKISSHVDETFNNFLKNKNFIEKFEEVCKDIEPEFLLKIIKFIVNILE